MKQISPGILELDKQFGGYGCEPTELYFKQIFGHDWVAAKYMVVSLWNASIENIPNKTVSFDDLVLKIRSEHDPYIFAEVITNGSLNFNNFEDSGQLQISTTRGFIGFSSISFGILILSPVTLCCCYICLKFKIKQFLFVSNANREEQRLLYEINSDKLENKKSNWASFLFPDTDPLDDK